MTVYNGFNSGDKFTSCNDHIQAIMYDVDTNTGGLVFTNCINNDKLFDVLIYTVKELITLKDVELLTDKMDNIYIPFKYKYLTITML